MNMKISIKSWVDFEIARFFLIKANYYLILINCDDLNSEKSYDML